MEFNSGPPYDRGGDSMACMAIAIPGVVDISETGDTIGKIWLKTIENRKT